MKDFILTGSRCYGIPHEFSDWDFLVRGSVVPERFLLSWGFRIEFNNKYGIGEHVSSFYRSSSNGSLHNAIYCRTEDSWWERLEARRICLEESPVTRSRAVEIHKLVESSGPKTFTGLSMKAWRDLAVS